MTTIRSKALIILTISLMFTPFQAFAQRPYYNYSTPYAQYPNYQQQSPIELLQMGIQVLQDYIKDRQFSNPDAVINFLDSQVSPFFDFEKMAEWSAGYYYHQMNSAQQYIFQSNLKKMFFTAFARIITAYGDAQPRIEFMQPRQISYGEIIATARVIPANGFPIRIDFRFAQGPKGWKIYDVGTNGSSAVAYYRSYFRNMIRSRGLAGLTQQY